MSGQRSSLGKWALTRRWEAHLTLPGLFSLVFIAVYFFGPWSLQQMISPGVFNLPFAPDRTVGLVHLISGFCILWSLVLAISTLGLTRDKPVWLLSIAIAVVLVLKVAMWLDGHSFTSRFSDLWRLTAGDQGTISTFLVDYQSLLGVAITGLFSLLFFAVLPMLYGDSRNPVVAMLIPSRWLALTTLVLFFAFALAFKLHTQGWSQDASGYAPSLETLEIFVDPLLLYMLMLYLARLQYRSWVRREAGHWKPRPGER